MTLDQMPTYLELLAKVDHLMREAEERDRALDEALRDKERALFHLDQVQGQLAALFGNLARTIKGHEERHTITYTLDVADTSVRASVEHYKAEVA
jgi:hypothetical protein